MGNNNSTLHSRFREVQIVGMEADEIAAIEQSVNDRASANPLFNQDKVTKILDTIATRSKRPLTRDNFNRLLSNHVACDVHFRKDVFCRLLHFCEREDIDYNQQWLWMEGMSKIEFFCVLDDFKISKFFERFWAKSCPVFRFGSKTK